MGKIAIVARFEANEGSLEDLLTLTTQHARRCLEREPGCLYFDIMVPREQDNEIVLYEIYKDQAALDSHLMSDHMNQFRKERTPFFKVAQASLCDLREFRSGNGNSRDGEDEP